MSDSTKREQLLAEIRAIPDGTICTVYASGSLVEQTPDHPYSATGAIYSIPGLTSVQRWVGDTLIVHGPGELSSRVVDVIPVDRAES